MLKRIARKLFYNPYRFARSNPCVKIGNSKLSRSFHVEFVTKRTGVAFQAGDNCILSCQGVFESDRGSITIGNGVFINGNTRLISRSRIDIEDHVTIAWGCTIYDHDSHSIDYRERVKDQERQLADWDSGNFIASKDWSVVNTQPIRICRNAWIGFDVVILKGVTIGEGAIIAARSVVTADIPPWSIAAGCPARVVKEIPVELRNPASRRPSDLEGVHGS